MPVPAPKSVLQTYLETIWWRPQTPPLLLRALAGIYGMFAARVAQKKRAGAEKLPVPVIVVGNISVGGSGKTPVTLWLIQVLKELGHNPGVISRGYGGTGPYPMLVGPNSDASMSGDEPLLISRRSKVPVVVSPQRLVAGQTLLKAYPNVDVLIADDGLQHLQLHRDLEICVIDQARKHGNGWLLPAGPLREPLSRCQTVDLVLLNGGEHSDERQRAFTLQPSAVRSLQDGVSIKLDKLKGVKVHAVAGIGNPERFFTLLEAYGLKIERHAFADHHPFTRDDLVFNDGRMVIMTEKDAVKCAEISPINSYYLAVDCIFSDVDAQYIKNILINLFNKNPVVIE